MKINWRVAGGGSLLGHYLDSFEIFYVGPTKKEKHKGVRHGFRHKESYHGPVCVLLENCGRLARVLCVTCLLFRPKSVSFLFPHAQIFCRPIPLPIPLKCVPKMSIKIVSFSLLFSIFD